MPVARDVLRHAVAAPGRVALLLDDGDGRRSVSYAELAESVRAGAARLVEVVGPRLAPGDVVAVDRTLAGSTPGGRWAAALSALLSVDLAGGVPLLCDTSWDAEHRDVVLASAGPHHRVSLADLAGSGTTGTGAHFVPDHRAGTAIDADLAWAGFTSGSTGRPRAVVRSRASWTGSFDEVTRLTGTTPESTVLVPGDLATSLYCFGAVHALSVGATLRPAPRPGDLAAAAPGCDVLHVTPAQLEASLDVLERAAAAGATPVGGRRTAFVGGAHLPVGLRARAGAAGLRVVSYYGAAELSFVAVDVDGTGLRPFPGVEIDVRPVAGAPHGTVWVRSPWLATGYLADAPGPLERSGGWASVGDLAQVPAAEALVLRGRGTGALTVGAATVLPEDVEAVLAAVPGVHEVVVLGTPHARWGELVSAVVVLDPAADHDDEDVLEALERAGRAGLAPAQRPRRFFAALALPRTSGGKVARGDVAALLADRPRPAPGAQHDAPSSTDEAPGVRRLRRSARR